MKRKAGLVLILVVAVILSIQAQSTDENNERKADTIVVLGGRKLIVHIKNVSATQINYRKPNNDEIFNISRKNVRKLIYHNGRIEELNRPVFMMVEEGNYKTVIVTDNIKDVEGLYPQGKIQGRSSNRSRNIKSAKKSATIKVQKKAANLGASYVYVTKREQKGGYGEIPTYVIEGIAYGFKPKREKKKEDDLE